MYAMNSKCNHHTVLCVMESAEYELNQCTWDCGKLVLYAKDGCMRREVGAYTLADLAFLAGQKKLMLDFSESA